MVPIGNQIALHVRSFKIIFYISPGALMNSFGWGISIGKGSERKRAEEAHFVCDFV